MQIGSRTNNFQMINKQKDNSKNHICFENRQIRSAVAAGLISVETLLPTVLPPSHHLHNVIHHTYPQAVIMLPVTDEHGSHGKNDHTPEEEFGIDRLNGHSLNKNGKPPVNYIKSVQIKRPAIGNETSDNILLPGEKPSIITMEN